MRHVVGVGLAALCCSTNEDAARTASPGAIAGDCEDDVESDRPCPGLLPQCPPATTNPDPTFVSVVATTDCAGEHFQESGSIEIVLAPPSTPPDTVVFLTRLTSGCSISTDVTVRNGQFPNWPWMTEGQTLDIELWHAGGPVRGGSPLWLTLKEPETGELYFTNHQSNWQLIELDLMPGILGFDVDLEGPQCEDLQGTQDFLYHQYNLRFHTPQSAAVLGGWQHGALVLPSGAQVRVQTHKAFVAYEHFLPPHPGVFDASRGPQAWFSAWKVQ